MANAEKILTIQFALDHPNTEELYYDLIEQIVEFKLTLKNRPGQGETIGLVCFCRTDYPFYQMTSSQKEWRRQSYAVRGGVSNCSHT